MAHSTLTSRIMLRTRKIGYGDGSTSEISLSAFITQSLDGNDLDGQHEGAVARGLEES